MSRAALRGVLPATLLVAPMFLALYVARGARLEPADFVFNNGTEVSTLDPATVTGVPEGRVIKAIFEGLTVKHPKTGPGRAWAGAMAGPAAAWRA